jgi:hypothetical protein
MPYSEALSAPDSDNRTRNHTEKTLSTQRLDLRFCHLFATLHIKAQNLLTAYPGLTETLDNPPRHFQHLNHLCNVMDTHD